MSDNNIIIVPTNPFYVPSEEHQHQSLIYLEKLEPHTQKIRIDNNNGILFYDCGENFHTISCPSCGESLGTQWWRANMDSDWNAERKTFQLSSFHLPCCQTNHTLNDLVYDWHQAFARFAIILRNLSTGRLDNKDKDHLEAILVSKLSIVYQHL